MTEAVIQVGLWEFIGALVAVFVAFVGVVWALGKLLLTQFEKRLNERRESDKEARERDALTLTRAIDAVKSLVETSLQRIQEVERDLYKLKAELPLHYVRREDWIRFGGVIEARIEEVMKLLNKIVRTRGTNDE